MDIAQLASEELCKKKILSITDDQILVLATEENSR